MGNNKRASSSKEQLISGFRALKVGQHYVYLRKHAGDEGRTLFVVNLPPDTTDRHLRALFSRAGQIQKVSFWQDKRKRSEGHGEEEEEEDEDEEEEDENEEYRGAEGKKVRAPAVVPLPPLDPRNPHELLTTGTSAHVTFLDDSSLQRALAMSEVRSWPDPFEGVVQAQQDLDGADGADQKKKRKRAAHATAQQAMAESMSAGPPPLGLQFLLARQRSLRPPPASIKAHADSVVARYEFLRANPKPKKSAIKGVTVGPDGELLDEDGFTIVQRGGKYGRTAEVGGSASVRVAREHAQDGEPKKKKKKLEMEDFYRFQRKEQKKEGGYTCDARLFALSY
ncbi:hypothetical protein L7F22_033943 [Adiantum nelumboides]|nr:hypothetical protein [Adiantum nelumboides]